MFHLRKIAIGMQNNRLLTLSLPEGDAPYKILWVNRLEGEESLSPDFRFVIELLSDNAQLDPKDFVGKLISVQLLRNDGLPCIGGSGMNSFGTFRRVKPFRKS